MTGQLLAPLLLAVAVLVRPGRLAASARLAALTPATSTRPAIQPRLAVLRAKLGSDPRLRTPLLASSGVGALTMALGGLPGLLLAPLVGAAVFFAGRWVVRRAPPRRKPGPAPDPLALASGWDLFAACLRGGLPVPAAVHAVAGQLPDRAAAALRRTAELIALGADPVEAWAPALAEPLTAELARGARRSARSGAALASVAAGLAETVRANADDLAEARSQRAAVAVAGPLALCFLPAFLCIGVVPVMVGLASRMFSAW